MYSVKQKKEVIDYVLNNDVSVYKAQLKFNINRETIRMWIAKYNTGGVNALKKSSKNKKYTGQFKVDVVEYMHEHHISLKKTCLKFLISSTSLVKEWDLIYRNEGKDVLLKGNYMSIYKKRNVKLEEKSKKELIEEIEQLKMENAYLKKLRALIQKGAKPNNGKK